MSIQWRKKYTVKLVIPWPSSQRLLERMQIRVSGWHECWGAVHVMVFGVRLGLMVDRRHRIVQRFRMLWRQTRHMDHAVWVVWRWRFAGQVGEQVFATDIAPAFVARPVGDFARAPLVTRVYSYITDATYAITWFCYPRGMSFWVWGAKEERQEKIRKIEKYEQNLEWFLLGDGTKRVSFSLPLYRVVTVPAAVWNGIHNAPVSLVFVLSVENNFRRKQKWQMHG